MLTRQDLVAPSVQDKNAGNSGDLVKHTCYVALVRELSQLGRDIHIVETHGGKAVYVSTNAHLRTARSAEGYRGSILGRAQMSCFAPVPQGFGSVAGLHDGEFAYAGSGALHARAVADGQISSLVILDKDAGVREVAERILSEPCFDAVRDRMSIKDPRGDSEVLIRERLARTAFGPGHVIHFDPFAFVMSPSDKGVRALYAEILSAVDQQVHDSKLAAASVFFTWGSNSAAARSDLFVDGGYLGGGADGFQDLIKLGRPQQRILVSWCWTYYFSLLLIVPRALRDSLGETIDRDSDWLKPYMRSFQLTAG